MTLHEEWLFKAAQDLQSSKILLHSDQLLLDIAVYHTQQCAEKALKAFLVFHTQEISKIHDLRILLEKGIYFDTSLEDIYDDCLILNPFSTLYRYPEGDLMPSKSEVVEAVKSAENILTIIREKILG